MNATAPVTMPNCTARKDSRADNILRPPDGSAKKSRNLGKNIKLVENKRNLQYKSTFQYNNCERVAGWLYRAAEVQAQRAIVPSWLTIFSSTEWGSALASSSECVIRLLLAKSSSSISLDILNRFEKRVTCCMSLLTAFDKGTCH